MGRSASLRAWWRRTICQSASLWVAAARARAPFDDDARVKAFFAHPTHGGDLAPRFTWRTAPRAGGWVELRLHAGEFGANGINFGKEGLGGRLPRAPEAPIDEARILTTVSLCDPALLWLLDTYIPGDMAHAASTWVSAIWPQNPEPLFALSAKSACLLDGANYVKPANEPLADGFKSDRPDGAADALPGSQRDR
jgi:hypothetical protein